MEALDLDSAPNAGIRFSIGAGDRDGHFTINRDDGYIAVKSELDRETVSDTCIYDIMMYVGHFVLLAVLEHMFCVLFS